LKNIVVFASGSGTNFQSIIDATQNGSLEARITGLVSNKDHAGALHRAKENNIPAFVLNELEYDDPHLYQKDLMQVLTNLNTDCIILAGYLRKIPAPVIEEYENRILNIHPSLLPKFGGKGYFGRKVHQAVIESGEQETGCSVHIVTEEYDDGPVIARARVPVRTDDTPESLANRVLAEEHKLYPKAIHQHLKTLS
jgi:formyltetrahydrofolate-dependent phosphoribosylglycinamide formyltransferase